MQVIFFYLQAIFILFTLMYLIDCLYRRQSDEIMGFAIGVMFCLTLFYTTITLAPFLKTAQVNPIIYQLPLGIIGAALVVLFWWFVSTRYILPLVCDILFGTEN